MIDRRAMLAGSSALILSAPRPGFAGRVSETVFLTCAKSGRRHNATVVDTHARRHWSLDLPGRGHGGAFRPGHADCVIFARRPGTFAIVADRTDGRLLHTLSSPAGRHFYGHGCFCADGRYLYTTENDFDGERGVIGVWEASGGYRRIAELDSFGIGPHDIRLMPDGRTLVVANGGILTHPDTGRHKLNIPDMEPSLVFLDRRDGRRMRAYALPRDIRKLSIRHLAPGYCEGREGAVFAAMQYEGPAEDHPPLIARVRRDRLAFMSAPPGIQESMRNYCGSIASDISGRIAAATCPRGNMVTFWSAGGAFHHAVEIRDGCGIAAGRGAGEFLLSGGAGDLVLYNAIERKVRRRNVVPNRRWDNHIASGA